MKVDLRYIPDTGILFENVNGTYKPTEVKIKVNSGNEDGFVSDFETARKFPKKGLLYSWQGIAVAKLTYLEF